MPQIFYYISQDKTSMLTFTLPLKTKDGADLIKPFVEGIISFGDFKSESCQNFLHGHIINLGGDHYPLSIFRQAPLHCSA
jgi:hypothetical protein